MPKVSTLKLKKNSQKFYQILNKMKLHFYVPFNAKKKLGRNSPLVNTTRFRATTDEGEVSRLVQIPNPQLTTSISYHNFF